MLRGDASFRLFCRAVAAEGGRGRTVHCCFAFPSLQEILKLCCIYLLSLFAQNTNIDPRFISFTRVRTKKYLDFTQIAQQNILLFTSVLLTVAITFELRAGMEERR